MPAFPAGDISRKEGEAFGGPSWTEVFGGSEAMDQGGRRQQLCELPSVKKMDISEICGEDSSAKAIGLVSFENEYLYLLRKFNWLRDVKCVHNVAPQNCNSCDIVRRKGRTQFDRICQPEADLPCLRPRHR